MFWFVIFWILWIWWVPPGTSENRPHRTSASSRSDARDTRRFVGAVLPSCDSQDQLIKLARYRWITGGSIISTETLLGKFVTLLDIYRTYLTNFWQICKKNILSSWMSKFQITRTSIMAAFRNVSPSSSSSNAKRIAPCFLAVRNSSPARRNL